MQIWAALFHNNSLVAGAGKQKGPQHKRCYLALPRVNRCFSWKPEVSAIVMVAPNASPIARWFKPGGIYSEK